MKVYAPGLVAGTTRSPCWKHDGTGIGTAVFGIPLEGVWLDVPDYFNQVTRGLPINDVIHAKLVDDWEMNYSVTDGRATELVGTRSYPFFNTFVCSSQARLGWRYLDVSRAAFLKEIAYSWKKGTLRTHYERVLTPYCADIGINQIRDGWHLDLYVCVPATITPEASLKRYSSGRMSLYYKKASLQIRFRNNTEEITALDPPLADVAKEVVSFLLSNQKLPSENASYDRIHRGVANILDHNMDQLYFKIINYYPKYYGQYEVMRLSPDEFPSLDLSRYFLLGEPEVIGQHLDPMLVTNPPFNAYWRNYLTQHAILEACESLPRLSDNSISNLIEVVGFIKALVVDHRIEMPKSLADAWLAYRYQYNTSKQDIEEAIKFVHRHMDLGTLDRLIVGRGISSHIINGTEVVCRCQVGAEPRHLSTLKDIWWKLDQYGLTPDFYALWDMVPYSFMVDWFLPISDIASVWDANTMYFSGEFYNLQDLCISFSYTREVEGAHISCYTRFAADLPTALNSFYWFDAPTAKTQTWGKRVLDAASIFIG